jgi:hypothetical protein
MKLINRYFRVLKLTVVVFVFGTLVARAQCQPAVNEGINKLAPYSFNGQINNLSVKAGKPSELHLAFYKGYTYKIQLAAEKENEAHLSFKILDENKNEIFNSNSGTQSDSWVFYSNTAQELIVVVTTTEKAKHCAVVLVGVQVPKNNNPMRYL